jgi:hypothetical protein
MRKSNGGKEDGRFYVHDAQMSEIKRDPGQMIESWRFADVLRKAGKHIHD